jgi:dihydrofolate synthase/folylpolyglutamate synthase
MPLPRAASAVVLAEHVRAALPAERPVTTHASPSAALSAALGAADPADRILVFGSFLTVGGVLKEGLPRLGATHTA